MNEFLKRLLASAPTIETYCGNFAKFCKDKGVDTAKSTEEELGMVFGEFLKAGEHAMAIEEAWKAAEGLISKLPDDLKADGETLLAAMQKVKDTMGAETPKPYPAPPKSKAEEDKEDKDKAKDEDDEDAKKTEDSILQRLISFFQQKKKEDEEEDKAKGKGKSDEDDEKAKGKKKDDEDAEKKSGKKDDLDEEKAKDLLRSIVAELLTEKKKDDEDEDKEKKKDDEDEDAKKKDDTVAAVKQLIEGLGKDVQALGSRLGNFEKALSGDSQTPPADGGGKTKTTFKGIFGTPKPASE